MQSEKQSKRNILYFLLAVLVAASIWFSADQTSNSGNPRTREFLISDIPIIYSGVDTALAEKGLMLLEEGTDATLDLTVTVGRLKGAQMTASDVQVTADLSNIESAGIQTVQYNIRFLGDFSSAVSKREASIAQATVNISELYSKIVDVKCELKGDVAEGYSARPLQLSVEKLEIRGQAEDIDPVSYAKVTMDIGDDVVETVSQTLNWQFYDENDRLLDSSGIHPTVENVQATLPVDVQKDLRLVVKFKEYPGASAGNLKVDISPPVIAVSGDAAKLRNIDTIELGTFDLMDLVTNSEVTGHTYSIIIPDGCQNLSGVTRATMTISFKDMAKMEITADQFDAANVPEGKTIRILTEELPITIFGVTGDVEAVMGEDITVIADLSNYSAVSGIYTVPAAVQVTTDGNVGVYGTYQVRVLIQDAPDE